MSSEQQQSGSNSGPPVEKPWAKSVDEVTDALNAKDNGLSENDAEERRKTYGENRLKAAKQKSAAAILYEQFKNPIILLLLGASVISFLFGQWLDGIAILIALLVNIVIGFVMELKAIRSLESLQKMARVDAKVRRDGEVKKIPAQQLVPGDRVVIEAGDIVTADLRLVEAQRMQADESALTGESVPVSKNTEAVDGDASLAERKSMFFKGTFVTLGSGEGIVAATGMKTELGKISEMAEAAEEEESPIEKRLEKLAYRLIWATFGVSALLIGIGLIRGQDTFMIIQTAIILAIAAIPEGLPIVATIALARGMWRMAEHNAIVNRLSSVETLGSTSVIFTDKTGTLTENRMRVTQFAPAMDGAVRLEEGSFSKEEESVDPSEFAPLREMIEVGVLCNNASIDEENPENRKDAVGDPVEIGLLIAGAKAGMKRDALLEKMSEVREVPFDPEIMMMATYHTGDQGIRVAVKGAPETVLDVCTSYRTEAGTESFSEEEKQKWRDRNHEMAKGGLRVLAVAQKQVQSKEAEPYEDLVFLGLVGMLDPAREDVPQAIESCHKAGIRVIMITGDQTETARNIGKKVGISVEGLSHAEMVVHGSELSDPEKLSDQERKKLVKTPIFARVNPGQKLDLIELHQKEGAIVAMTGDGVNDAPALKKADIGVAMGLRGTQVAREAADIVLQDDAFKTILVAVEQGRAIFKNIRRFILYLLSGNVGEIMIVAFAILAGAPLPLMPLQILYLNMIGDVFPALALGLSEGNPENMKKPPRDADESILTKYHWVAIMVYGLIFAGAVLGAFALAFKWLGMDTEGAVTVSFLSLAFGRLWHVFNMRERGSNLFINTITTNPYVWGALALCTGLLLIGVYIPWLGDVLHLVNPGGKAWLLIIGSSLIPLIFGQLWAAFSRRDQEGERNPERKNPEEEEKEAA